MSLPRSTQEQRKGNEGLGDKKIPRLTRPALYLMPPLFSSFPARVTLEALPGGVPKRSASRMPVELERDTLQVSREGPASCCHHRETLALVTMTITAAIYLPRATVVRSTLETQPSRRARGRGCQPWTTGGGKGATERWTSYPGCRSSTRQSQVSETPASRSESCGVLQTRPGKGRWWEGDPQMGAH